MSGEPERNEAQTKDLEVVTIDSVTPDAGIVRIQKWMKTVSNKQSIFG